MCLSVCPSLIREVSLISEFPSIPEDANHRAARSILEAADWKRFARGDWSIVHASPCGRFVARVTAFDPADALHAMSCLRNPDAPYFQRIFDRRGLPPAGDIVFMERLEPAPIEAASELCCLLGEFGDLDDEAPDAGESPLGEAAREDFEARRKRDPLLVTAYERLQTLAATGRATIGYFEGLEVRPENVLRDDGNRETPQPRAPAPRTSRPGLAPVSSSRLRVRTPARIVAS